jgi:hypothetical protein
MPDQLFTCYVENPLAIISINSGSWGVVIVVWLEIKTVIGKVGSEREGQRGGWEKRMGAVGFCGPCVCLGIFLL